MLQVNSLKKFKNAKDNFLNISIYDLLLVNWFGQTYPGKKNAK